MKSTFFICLSLIVVCLSFISCSHIPRPLPEKVTEYYEITEVNVIDVINETIKYNQDVVIQNGIIISIEAHTSIKNSMKNQERVSTEKTIENSIVARSYTGNENIHNATETIINGHGKYLIPGLWDNHSTVLKTSPELDFPLYIANGVTSIRSNLSCPNEDEISLYACMKDKMEWQKAVSENDMLGPLIHGWGTYPIHGKRKNHPDSPPFHSAHTVEQARKVVRHYAKYPKAQRPFFLKTYNWIKPEQYAELSRYAKRHGFELSGHMPRSLNLHDVVDAGQRSIAHARLFMFDCATLSPGVLSELQRGKHKKTPLPQLYRLLLGAFDEKGCQKKYEYLAKHNVFLNPTLITRRNDYYMAANKLDEIQGLEYVHYLMKLTFSEALGELGDNLSNDDIRAFKDFYILSAQTIALAQKAGVKVLAGTDSWNEYVVPGFALHEELQALAQAGLDNYAVLQSATINGAKYFRIEDEIGSINVGKVANMVLLNANPIENIKHTQAIHTVFQGTQIYKTEKLSQLKQNVKKLSNSHSITAKILMMVLQNPNGI